MIRSLALVVVFVLINTSCSSAPEKQYRVTKYLELTNTWMARGDRKRQEEKLDLALSNYDTGLKYANLRNDLTLMGVLQLKKATIYINQSRFEFALKLIEQAKALHKYEGAELKLPIRALEAKLAHAQGRFKEASASALALSEAYKDDNERSIYYRWLGVMYSSDSIMLWEEMDRDLRSLDNLKARGELENIEILSFVVYNNALWKVRDKHAQAQIAIEQAIAHFSELELTNKIRDCYALAVKLYKAQGNEDKAAYFLKRLDSFNPYLKAQ
ncbi:hypothetical protein J8M21_17700 [Pseudoalteromonas luteoviolacea]|uniref:hypothetical protein n=1 Tax=Pseudoalteromonas luteoviolacea TaxID=43657 RepID=UPI001B39E1EC|nr:hypothetical protein [Pseudoalteromonas luteoviolacea]MBQ4879053.1 hypothetical protein [Pseudoalteromonas luteoviolacea]MBQ4908192.1 hypothetical protein [Pseudoalteromonas luteoviolacea]